MKENNTIPVTVICPIFNEINNIDKFLISTRNFERVIFIDSNSNDGTLDKIKRANREIHQFVYQKGGVKKRQYALDNLVKGDDWILLLDADEEVSKQLEKEIRAVVSDTNNSTNVYSCVKLFHFMGKRFRFGGFSFRALLLFQPRFARFEKLTGVNFDELPMEIHERIITDGNIKNLKNGLIHNDFNSLSHYIGKHNQYSSWEAKVRISYFSSELKDGSSINANLFGNTQERRRFLKLVISRVSFEPLIWFVYHYVFRLGFLEGRRGLIAALIRMQYIQNVKAKIYEASLEK